MSDDDISAFEIPSLLVTLVYFGACAALGIALAVLSHFWGSQLLLSFADISKGDVSNQGLSHIWFIFAWALGATLVLLMIEGIGHTYKSRAIRVIKGIWISLNAGIFEELMFRWLLFFIAMITMPFLNLITFGLVKFVYTHLLMPVANFCTFGVLDHYFTGSSWVLGAAIVSVNGKFRDGHEGNGLLGWINSWFIGMVMFYLMLNYNIQTAMVAHVLYDVIVFTIAAVAVRVAPGDRFSPVVWNTGRNRL